MFSNSRNNRLLLEGEVCPPSPQPHEPVHYSDGSISGRKINLWAKIPWRIGAVARDSYQVFSFSLIDLRRYILEHYDFLQTPQTRRFLLLYYICDSFLGRPSFDPPQGYDGSDVRSHVKPGCALKCFVVSPKALLWVHNLPTLHP